MMDVSERVQLAQELFRKFHTRCFWYCNRDLVITESLLPMVARGLRLYGGREGFRLALKVQFPEGDELTFVPLEPAE